MTILKKNHIIKVKVTEDTLNNFIKKCKQLGLDRTHFIEKISNEPIAFLNKDLKKVLN